MSLHNALQGADDREAARDFLAAFDADSVSRWAHACQHWAYRPYRGKVGKAVKQLREAWWHGGTDADIQRCKDAAENLRAVLGD